nr:transposase [Colwellia sp. Bg11-28]
MLSKRFMIETINNQLKDISFIEYSRHRSMNGFMFNLMAELVAYRPKEKKPSVNLSDLELKAMVVA